MASRGNQVFAQSFDVDDRAVDLDHDHDHNHKSGPFPSPHLSPARRFSPTTIDRRNRLFQKVHFDVPHFCVGIYLRIMRFTLEHRGRTMEEEEGVEMAVFKA